MQDSDLGSASGQTVPGDRALLEGAAKTEGTVYASTEATSFDGYPVLVRPSHGLDFQWDPLIDDADAFRLAVKLELHVIIIGEGMCEVENPERNLAPVFEHSHDGDTGSATRRAIVRAAAALNGLAARTSPNGPNAVVPNAPPAVGGAAERMGK
jgi:hypothetical protein